MTQKLCVCPDTITIPSQRLDPCAPVALANSLNFSQLSLIERLKFYPNFHSKARSELSGIVRRCSDFGWFSVEHF